MPDTLGATTSAAFGSAGQSCGKGTMVIDEWSGYSRDGFLHLGCIAEPAQLQALRQRADDLALQRVKQARIQVRLHPGEAGEGMPLYREIVGLENDDLFLTLIRQHRLLAAAESIHGRHAAISVLRAAITNQTAAPDADPPWEQGDRDAWRLDRDPLMTIWVAIDDATGPDSGLTVVPGSHRLGLLQRSGTEVEPVDAAIHCTPDRLLSLNLEAGHAVLLHNALIRRSGVGPAAGTRRALVVTCMDGRATDTVTGERFPLIAGSLPTDAPPFVRQLQQDHAAMQASSAAAHDRAASLEAETAALRQTTAEAVAYARSLEAEAVILRQMREAAEQYARSLEAERDRIAAWAG